MDYICVLLSTCFYLSPSLESTVSISKTDLILFAGSAGVLLFKGDPFVYMQISTNNEHWRIQSYSSF